MTPLLKAAAEITILVVDDTPDNLRLIAKILESQGYQVRKARSGKMALQGVERHLPDLILLDIHMPEMNGYEVCEKLKAFPQTANIPIIFISALDQIQDKVRAFEIGGLDYITKPFQDQEILIRVRNQLLIQQQQRQLEKQHQLLRAKNKELEQEVQERLKAEAEVKRLAITDELTGLLNRRGFLLIATQQIQMAQRTKSSFCILFADVDGLKKINDNFGHTTGDQVIIDAAKVIQETFREGDILARLGGDEFIVFLPICNENDMCNDNDDIEARLKKNIAAFNNKQRRQYNLSISFGLLKCSSEEKLSLDEYINLADKLMYEQKKTKNKCDQRNSKPS